MNDTKRLKVVFLVEYNKHLALARMSAMRFLQAFNLIATGLVNCLIVSECSKMHHSEAENLKKNLGRGQPLPNPTPLHLRRLDTRAFGARHVPPFENLGSTPGL